jgi:hypothetical protein
VRVVTEFVERFLAPTAEEQRSLAAEISKMPVGETDDYEHLLRVVKLYELCEARRAWVHQLETVVIGGRRVARADALKEAERKALQSLWFQQGSGKQFLREFLTGRDMLLVGAGLGIAFWVHVMSTVTGFTSIYMPKFFGTIWWNWIQTLAIIGCGCVVPLYYVGCGRALLDQIRECGDGAATQLKALKAKMDQDDLERALAATKDLGVLSRDPEGDSGSRTGPRRQAAPADRPN